MLRWIEWRRGVLLGMKGVNEGWGVVLGVSEGWVFGKALRVVVVSGTSKVINDEQKLKKIIDWSVWWMVKFCVVNLKTKLASSSV